MGRTLMEPGGSFTYLPPPRSTHSLVSPTGLDECCSARTRSLVSHPIAPPLAGGGAKGGAVGISRGGGCVDLTRDINKTSVGALCA